MNIFYLHNSPNMSAQGMVDAHINKQIVESCQMLAAGFELDHLKYAPKTQKGTVRKHGYLHHPCTKWATESYDNFGWLWRHARHLNEQRHIRFKSGNHFCYDFLIWAGKEKPSRIHKQEATKPAMAFGPYAHLKRNRNIHLAYQDFYVCDKLFNKRGERMDNYTNMIKPPFWHDLKYLYKDPRNRVKFPKDFDWKNL